MSDDDSDIANFADANSPFAFYDREKYVNNFSVRSPLYRPQVELTYNLS